MLQQNRFLQDNSPMSGFFKRIPMVCDELRQNIDNKNHHLWWMDIQNQCKQMVERVSRLKRCHRIQHVRNPSLSLCNENVERYWDIPLLHNLSLDEYKIFGMTLSVHGPTLCHIQREIQIHPLPSNLLEYQLACLGANDSITKRLAFLKSRRYICMNCLLNHKNAMQCKLRLDTLTHELVCTTCLKNNLICVNLLGRIMRFKKMNFLLCPCCLSIQQYTSGEQFWVPGTNCKHKEIIREPISKNKTLCSVCSDPALQNPVDRVDHITGIMNHFYYCQRHFPRPETLQHCVNVRQMIYANSKTKRSFLHK